MESGTALGTQKICSCQCRYWGDQSNKKNLSDSLDISVSEQICESNLGKPFIFAKNQSRDSSCPYCLGGEESRAGPWAGCVLTARGHTLDTVWDGHSVSEQCWEVRGQQPSAICVFTAQEWRCYREASKVKGACTSEKWGQPVVVCSFLFGFQSTFLTSVLIKSVLPQPLTL